MKLIDFLPAKFGHGLDWGGKHFCVPYRGRLCIDLIFFCHQSGGKMAFRGYVNKIRPVHRSIYLSVCLINMNNITCSSDFT